MILITCSENYSKERVYIYDVIFKEFLGISYEIIFDNTENIIISFEGDNTKKLSIADILFMTCDTDWLALNSLPQLPLSQTGVEIFPSNLRTLSSILPIIYGKKIKESYCNIKDESIELGIDIFGSAFFMLTRYEEYFLPEKDNHHRFPAMSSLAHKAGFLERPIVNEYLEILWACMQTLWPQLRRKDHVFQMRLTHDVDHLYYYRLRGLPRLTAKTLIKEGPIKASSQPIKYLISKFGYPQADPFYSFDSIMSLSESVGLKSTFYFIMGHTTKIDGNTHLYQSQVRKLIKQIHSRGHRVGLHGSYNSYNDPVQLQKEFQRLLSICESEKVIQSEWGSRQHYLRWATPQTFLALENAGLNYDTTLSYAAHAGFRCGTCYDFPVFDLKQRKQLKLIEKPLIAMEGSLLVYMKLSYDAAHDAIISLRKSCQFFGGIFTLLWHNSNLLTKEDKNLYTTIVTS